MAEKDFRARLLDWADKVDEFLKKTSDKAKRFYNTYKRQIYYGLGIIVVFAVIYFGSNYISQPKAEVPQIQEEKPISFYINPELSIELEYVWIDNISSSEWECTHLSRSPSAKLTYTVTNLGTSNQTRILLPVPAYIYPDYFQTKPKFTWMDRLYIVLDQGLAGGSTANYEFVVDMKMYNALCGWRNEVSALKSEINNQYNLMMGYQISSNQKDTLNSAYYTFNSVEAEFTNAVSSSRGSGPEVLLANYDKIISQGLQRSFYSASDTIMNNYATHQASSTLDEVKQGNTETTDTLDKLKTEQSALALVVTQMRQDLESQLKKPTLEDILAVYFNATQGQ